MEQSVQGSRGPEGNGHIEAQPSAFLGPRPGLTTARSQTDASRQSGDSLQEADSQDTASPKTKASSGQQRTRERNRKASSLCSATSRPVFFCHSVKARLLVTWPALCSSPSCCCWPDRHLCEHLQAQQAYRQRSKVSTHQRTCCQCKALLNLSHPYAASKILQWSSSSMCR